MKALTQHAPKRPQLFIRQKSWGSSSDMQLTHCLPTATVLQMQIQLALQITHVRHSTFMVLGDNFVAGAVVAKRVAKRNVHIERHWLICCSRHFALLQGQDIVTVSKRLNKPIRSWVRGVTWTRYVVATQEFGGDKCHEIFLDGITLQQHAIFILDVNQEDGVQGMSQFDSHHSAQLRAIR